MTPFLPLTPFLPFDRWDPSGHEGTATEEGAVTGEITALQALQFNGYRVLYAVSRLTLFAFQWQPLIFLGAAGTAQLVGKALSHTARSLNTSGVTIPAGTPTDVRGRILEDAAGGNLNGNFPGADSDRFRVFQSIRSHDSGSPQLLLNAIRNDLTDLNKVDLSKQIEGETASGDYHIYEPNYFQAKAVTVIIPLEQGALTSQPDFAARLSALAEEFESGVQVIAYEGFEQ